MRLMLHLVSPKVTPCLRHSNALVQRGLMFRSINNNQSKLITIYFEGKTLRVQKDLNVATALLGAGISNFRVTTINNENRGPYCMMGICFDCLINIDGMDNQQSCMVKVNDGMKINRQIIRNSSQDER
jgi:hypothetical protein